MYATEVHTSAVREAHVFDVERLTSFMAQQIPSFVPPLQVRQFKHGQSNPTFLLADGSGTKYVLRKKPPGKLLSSAHMVEREYMVMKALKQVNFPVPDLLAFTADSSVIGTPFYIMQFVTGRIFTDPSLPGLPPQERAALFKEFIRVMAFLHSVDYKKVGLGAYGKEGSYYARQVATWTRQYRASATEEVPAIESLITWLSRNVPEELPGDCTIVHGDMKFDNVIFHPTEPRIIAVLDWELSTLGHPLADVAYSCLPYSVDLPGNSLIDKDMSGIPSQAEYVKQYCQHTGRAFPIPKWHFYVAFSAFRLAGIAQGVYKRFLQGNASSTTAGVFGAVSKMCLEAAWSLVEAEESKLTTTGEANVRHGSPKKGVSTMEDIMAALPEPRWEPVSERSVALQKQLWRFLVDNVFPIERQVHDEVNQPGNRWKIPPVIERLKAKAQQAGLWNLFLPDRSNGGAGLSNSEYAPLAELMGYSPHLAPEIFNCNAPDTGNMELLAHFGTEQQKKQWLAPLLAGQIRSCFGMTEPAVASSDATNIECRITRDGEHYVINGRKWWITGAGDPRCKLCIVMGKTDPDTPNQYRQQSMVLVPMDAPGVKLVRPLTTFGYDDAPSGHCELLFENVRVPLTNILGGEGKGFEMAQARLGPGRIHHCMRMVGLAERVLHTMRVRVQERIAFGRPLAEHGIIQQNIAFSRIEIEQARLLTLKAAHMMDTVGNRHARKEIAMIKVVAPNMALKVIDRAIQAFGAAGLSEDFGLAAAFAGARSLRLADGPDEVHMMTIARLELQQHKGKALTQKGGATEAIKRYQTAIAETSGVLSVAEGQDLVEIYALFKQSSAGDNTTPQPNASDVRSYGKWMAWAGLKGMRQEEAQTKYADKIQELQRRKHATTKL